MKRKFHSPGVINFVLCNFILSFSSQHEGDEGILEDYINENTEEEPCYGKRCTANEHCCPGSVCVDVDGGKCKTL